MEKMKNCGNCAAACGIEGKNEVVGCKEDGKLHNAQEQNTCFYVKDCDTCVHCHGITFRLVCWDCYKRLMAKGYDGEYYDEADEQIEDDY